MRLPIAIYLNLTRNENSPMSLRQAINQKCRECIYDPIGGDGNWRQQVGACTSSICPLYPDRPTSNPQKTRSLDTGPENGQNSAPAE